MALSLGTSRRSTKVPFPDQSDGAHRSVHIGQTSAQLAPRHAFSSYELSKADLQLAVAAGQHGNRLAAHGNAAGPWLGKGAKRYAHWLGPGSLLLRAGLTRTLPKAWQTRLGN